MGNASINAWESACHGICGSCLSGTPGWCQRDDCAFLMYLKRTPAVSSCSQSVLAACFVLPTQTLGRRCRSQVSAPLLVARFSHNRGRQNPRKWVSCVPVLCKWRWKLGDRLPFRVHWRLEARDHLGLPSWGFRRATSGSLKGLVCGVRRAGSLQCSKGQGGILRAQEDEVKEKLIWCFR